MKSFKLNTKIFFGSVAFIFSMVICAGALIAQGRMIQVPENERVRIYDVTHITIDISFDREKKEVIGNVKTSIVPLTSGLNKFEIDAVGFNINYIRDESERDLNYDYDNKKITVKTEKEYTPNDTLTYTVDYTCVPQRGLYFIYPTELNPSMPNQIWTQGEDEDNRYWIPVYDYPNDKATFELFISVENKYKTLSNGYLDFSNVISGTNIRRDHWVMDKPNSTYLIMLAVGDFNVISDETANAPVYSYVDQNINYGDAQYSFRNVSRMMKGFSEKFEYEYPWNKYAEVVVEDFIFGGMENVTATVLNKRVIFSPEVENDYTSESTVSHELAHQWWGDLVTCANWKELWLNESFATYSADIWKEISAGEDELDYEVLKEGDGSLRIDSIIGRYPVWAGYGNVTTNVYDKGSVILNSFRHILGKEFFPALANYLKKYNFKNVESVNLLDEFIAANKNEKISSDNLKKMFTQWIWKAGSPEFQTSYVYNAKTKTVELNVKQIQKIDSLTSVFLMPVDIRLKNSSEDTIETIMISKKEETFNLPLKSAPEMVVFDCGNYFLDKNHFEKPFSDWEAQYRLSEKAVDRMSALRGMKIYLQGDNSNTAGKPPITIDQIAAVRLLDEALNKDSFWGVRVEAAKVLGADYVLDRTGKVLRDSYEMQTSSRVKREIIRALGKSKRQEDADFILDKVRNETNDYLIAEGISALAVCLSHEKIYDAVAPFAGRTSHRDVIQSAVIMALNAADDSLGDERIKNILMGYAFGIDVSGSLRTTALYALVKYAGDEDVKSLAMKYADYNFLFVKRALINLLSYSMDSNAAQLLRDMESKTTDPGMRTLLLNSVRRIESN